MNTRFLKAIFALGFFIPVLMMGQEMSKSSQDPETPCHEKRVIYQVFTRLFGNQSEACIPWGTIEQNGVGKFADFTDAALEGIRELGITDIWYTGVLHHAVVTDYSRYGISRDDPDVVKGRAGSPYAVKDYYQVDPDLAIDPANRLSEFEALIQRTHNHGMKVIIDIVPNHIARRYVGLNNPEGVGDFGAADDRSVEYRRDNNFYYIPGTSFEVPDLPESLRPLGGQFHALVDGVFEEIPAKWTGNGSRKAKPDPNDWYETVKINYGVRPDESYDFPLLPQGYESLDVQAHLTFWQTQKVPDSWRKFHDIALFWLDRGVDGFRFDMAEMVPVEFWSYLNASIKTRNPDALLLAEVYQPQLYRDYLHLGKMDYLYDKVDLYDTLKAVLRGEAAPLRIAEIQESFADIEHHMLHFLENHDEQRIASPEFAGDPFRALPLMVVSATLSTSPTLVYFAQDVGEDGSEDAGFGDPSRTSIFDYIGVPAHQRWMNGGAFDGGRLTDRERSLRNAYSKLLNLTLEEPAFTGAYRDLQRYNLAHNPDYPADRVFSYLRASGDSQVLVVVNFSDQVDTTFDLLIPCHQFAETEGIAGEQAELKTLWGEGVFALDNTDRETKDKKVTVSLPVSGSVILKF